MTGNNRANGFVPNPSYSEEDWDEVSDNPEMTKAQFVHARPLSTAMPDLLAAVRRRRATRHAATKEQIAFRIDRDVVEAYRASGPDWQDRMNEALRKAIGL